MSDLEKLVELLSGVQVGGVALDHEALKANAVQNEEVADYLIVHGVTVQEKLVAKQVVIDKKYDSARCPSCNAVLSISSRYCWQCGQKVTHKWTVKQTQKPMTMEELKEIYFMREDHVWPHENKPPYLYLDSSIEKNDHLWVAWSIVVDFLETGYRKYTVESYGKTWRCWTEKPTEEERKNAKWEE